MSIATKRAIMVLCIAGLIEGTSLAQSNEAKPGGEGGSEGKYDTTKKTGKHVKEKHACKGQNSCKGKGGCKTGDNGCKGKNSCKGKGGCTTDGSKMPSE